VGDDLYDAGNYRDTGPLLGESCKVTLNGYVRPCPIDVDGDGKMSLLCGDEPGFVTLTKNVGDRNRPAFADPRKATDPKGRVLRLHREAIIPDNNGERNSGQLKPCLCDWDGDGRTDLIVGGNTNRILWLERYDAKRNTYRRVHQLEVKGIADAFCARKGPVVLDFDEDGREELLAVDSQRRVCLFRQGKGPQGRMLLEPPVPLLFTSGKAITTYDVGLRAEPHICLAACDWTGSGTHDLIISANWQTCILENVGSNRRPRFKRPAPLRNPDGSLLVTSHHESHVAAYDWDNDGRLDLMIGGEAGTVYLFHRDWLAGATHSVTLERAID